MEQPLEIDHTIKTTGPIPNKICSNNYSQLNIDLSEVTWFDPDILARLKCVIDLAFQKQMQISVVPPNRRDCADYAGRMGLFDGTLIGGEEYKYPHHKHESHTFFPLLKIENDWDNTLQEKCLKLVENTLEYKPLELAEHFSEIADNVYNHSGEQERTGWGYAQAQAQRDGEIKIAVSDTGVGFLGSYERTNQINNREEIDIIIDAFKELESSLNNGVDLKHRGLGLYGVYEYIKEQSGTIQVWSGKSYVKINGKDEPIKQALPFKVIGVLFEVSLCLSQKKLSK